MALYGPARCILLHNHAMHCNALHSIALHLHVLVVREVEAGCKQTESSKFLWSSVIQTIVRPSLCKCLASKARESMQQTLCSCAFRLHRILACSM